MKHWLWIILAALFFGEDRVIQPTGDVITTEGETVTLGCTFETTTGSPTLFWYKQEVNDYPKYMLKCFSKTADKSPEFQNDRFDAKINKTSVPLKFQKLQLSDSAVYYCALRPTVTVEQLLYSTEFNSQTINITFIQHDITAAFFVFSDVSFHSNRYRLVLINSSGIDNIQENHQSSSSFTWELKMKQNLACLFV
uniref:Ig-like domain-containing protein n=1 Tax=Sander lucioperca TaxID=283035 RepID=A0A8C9XAR6_SANLU